MASNPAPIKGNCSQINMSITANLVQTGLPQQNKTPFTSYKRTPETVFSFTYYFKEMLGSDLILDTWKGTCRQNQRKVLSDLIKKRVYLYICLHRCGMQFNTMHPSLWTSHVSCCPQIYIIVSPCTNRSLCVCICVIFIHCI